MATTKDNTTEIKVEKLQFGTDTFLAVRGLENKIATSRYVKNKFAAEYSTAVGALLADDDSVSKLNKTSMPNESFLQMKVLFHAANAKKITQVREYSKNAKIKGNSEQIAKYERQLGILELCEYSIEGNSFNAKKYSNYIEYKVKNNPDMKRDQKIRQIDKFIRMEAAAKELSEIGFVISSDKNPDSQFIDGGNKNASLKMLTKNYFLDTDGLKSCYQSIVDNKNGHQTELDKLETKLIEMDAKKDNSEINTMPVIHSNFTEAEHRQQR
jgi:hypothetical protein